MKKSFTIAIFLSSFILLFVISNLAIAQQSGQGFFLEKGHEFFIFDNLYINGYLTVGQDNLDKKGEFGDVFVGDELILDENSSFIFCKDQRQSQTNAALNRNCANKVLVWFADPDKGLEILDPGYSQLQTNKVEANKIILEATDRIYTNVPVVVKNGCFSNYDSNCNPGELETDKLFVKSLGLLGSNTWLTLDANYLKLGLIDLGNVNNYSNHKICWLSNNLSNCPRQRFTHANFVDTDGRTAGFDGLYGKVLCCYLTGFFD